MKGEFGQNHGLPNGEALLLWEITVGKKLVLQREKGFVGVACPGKDLRFVTVGPAVQTAQVFVRAGNAYGNVAG